MLMPWLIACADALTEPPMYFFDLYALLFNDLFLRYLFLLLCLRVLLADTYLTLALDFLCNNVLLFLLMI